METVTSVLVALGKMPMALVNGLIALSAIALAAFAIYVVLAVTKGRKRR